MIARDVRRVLQRNVQVAQRFLVGSQLGLKLTQVVAPRLQQLTHHVLGFVFRQSLSDTNCVLFDQRLHVCHFVALFFSRNSAQLNVRQLLFNRRGTDSQRLVINQFVILRA